MAHVYVRSGAGGGATGADWANAYLTVAAALTAKAAGDDFWVAADHTENPAAAITWTAPGTLAAPNRIMCAIHTGSVPPAAADLRNPVDNPGACATIANTGVNNITFAGVAYCYGIQFTCSSAASAATFNWSSTAQLSWIHEKCKFIMGTTGANAFIFGGNSVGISYRVEFINTPIKFANIVQAFSLNSGLDFFWRDTASAIDATGSLPTNLFASSSGNNRGWNVYMRNLDLSALTSGKTLFAAQPGMIKAILERCKLDANVSKVTTPTGLGADIQFINCEEGAGTNYSFEKYNLLGIESVETTITRAGSEATDRTQLISMKLASTANARPALPFISTPLVRWNDSTSSITVTVYGVWAGASVPNNDECWMEVDYLGDASSSMGSKATSGRATQITTPAATTVDAVSNWAGSLSPETEFKMSVTFTPAQKGNIVTRIYVGAVSATIYIDPVPEISGQAISRAFAA